jgi:membrane protein DedA with SNARE-associated domain
VFSLVGSIISALLWVLTVVGIPGLFALMVVESVGIPPLPSEIILPFAGFLLVEGTYGFTWPIVVTVSVLGGMVGAVIAYELGRWGGTSLLLRWGPRVGVGQKEIDRVQGYFDHYGPITVLLCRLLPLVRAYISYPAGVGKMERARFLGYTFVGQVPFVILLVYLGTLLGKNYDVLVPYFNLLDVVLVAGAVVLGLVLYLRYRRERARAAASPPPASTAR